MGVGRRRFASGSAILAVALALLSAGCAGKNTKAPTLLSNTVRWSTASEVDNFGFDVYRAESPDGPWTRITEQPVAGAGTSDLVRDYRWVDPAVMPETEYFYFVESISLSGERRRFTPVMRAPPKRVDPATTD